MAILLTGFTPFLNNQENPSSLLLPSLQDKDIFTLELPVSYNKAPLLLKEKIEEVKPSLILSFGLASSRKKISLERTAYNLMDAMVKDNDGTLKHKVIINPSLPSTLECSFDLVKLQHSLEEKGLETLLSKDPGRYICNLVYFLDLASEIPSLFIHLPTLENLPLSKDILLAKELIKLLA